jgi:hypothetical protein
VVLSSAFSLSALIFDNKSRMVVVMYFYRDLLKNSILDTSLSASSSSQDKENKYDNESSRDYMACLCFMYGR